MYENYEISEGGWLLPAARSMMPGTVIENVGRGDKYVSVYTPPNMKEANRSARKKRVCSEVERGAAWTAFLPIVGAALKVWVEYTEKETYSILDVWDHIDSVMIILAASTVLLFIVSAVASRLEKKYHKAMKRHLRDSYTWKRVEDEPDLLSNPYPELAGLAKTEEELKLLAKEKKLEELLGESLNNIAERRKNQSPISDEDYL